MRLLTAPMLHADETVRWTRAYEFAAQAHGEQKRKYTGEPYWYHVVNVASTVSHVPGRSIEMIEAALLHDVLEDTPTDPAFVRAIFGGTVVRYVGWLTNADVGNRQARKHAECIRIAAASKEVKTIKLADVIDNAPSIFEHDPSFAPLFAREKVRLLEALRGGDVGLWMEAHAILHDYLQFGMAKSA